jgi:TonB-linked SusC/RagA family outer membrane protein
MKHVKLFLKLSIMRNLLCILCVCCFSLTAFAQESGKLTGKVVDKDGETLPGVTIQYTNGTRGVVTDIDGHFEMDKVPIGTKLSVNLLGMETKQIIFDGKRDWVFVLQEKANDLDEVTVVAFATQKKESVVSSITTVKPGDLKIPSSNLTTAFAGRIAGMIAYQRNGEPGLDNAEFFIRGVTTFGYRQSPLILIDNNESSTQELSRMQPDDIAAFSILKDAAAAALYGSRGANGVIMVTTKSGKEGKPKISVRYEEAMSQPTKLPELADPITYMRLHNEAVRTRNPLGTIPYTQEKIDKSQDPNRNQYIYPVTDWYNDLFKDFANNHRLNFSVSGGGKAVTYFVSGSVINDNGVLKVDKVNNFNNNVSLNRYTLRSNVNINLTPTTEVIARMSGAFDDYNGPINGGSAVFNQVMKSNPVMFPAYYAPDENYQGVQHVLFGNARKGASTLAYTNPYADMVRGYQESNTSQISVQFEAKQKLDFIAEGLSLRGMFNTNHYANFSINRAYSPYYYGLGSYDKDTGIYVLEPLAGGTEWLSFTEGPKTITSAMYFESVLNYAHLFGDKHDVGALLVYTMRESSQTQTENGSDLQRSLPSRNLGLAGRATYGYDSRYFVEFNFGYNGSERFSKKERFGFFPSMGAAWIVSNEAFWEKIKEKIHNLKLKASYGFVGNDAIGSANDRFFYLSNVNMTDYNRSSAFGTYGTESRPGMSISRYANDKITWEQSEKINLAVESGFFRTLDLTVEVYKENRSNILMTRSNIPTTMGLTAGVSANVGKAESKGIDIALNLNHAFNKEVWIQGMGNFTYAVNKYTVYEQPDYPDAPWRSYVGYAINQPYGYIAERLFIDEEDVRNSPTQFGEYMAGDIKYMDLNGDGKITSLDQAPIGYPASPQIVYGFGLSSGYKTLDFSFFFQGLARESFMMSQYDGWGNVDTNPFIGGQSALLKAFADDHWSEDNRNEYALYPRLSEGGVENNKQSSTWWLRDGSFLRLKSVELGYTVPRRITDKAAMSRLRIYVSGNNLLTFSKFKMWDPESGGNGMGYPVQRVYNAGIQIEF